MKVPSKIVFITGFMAVGKSFWGKTLSDKLHLEFLDLDAYIESKEGRSIAQIIREEGEAAFRKIERHRLKESIDYTNANIISLGGGTLLTEENLNLVKENGILIWLKKDSLVIEELKEIEKRPLYDSNDPGSLYETRKSGYAQADRIIDLDSFHSNKYLENALLKYLRESLNL